MSNTIEISQSRHYSNLLDRARELFWKYGFKRVSIEEICSKAGTSKMTFYRLFSNKSEIAKAVFDREIARSMSSFRKLLESELTVPEKIHQMILMKSEGTHDISQEFLQDFYNNPELGLKEHIETEMKKAWKEVIEDFKRAQEKKIFRQDFKPELFFALAQLTLSLTSDKNVLQLYNSPREMIMEITNLMVYGIMPHE